MISHQPTCDIIIPTYQNGAVLLRTIAALFSQTVPAEWQVRLVITDDGSADNTLDTIKKTQPPTNWSNTIVATGAHTGAAGARNRGLSQSKADILLFLGADIILRPGALAAHLNFHRQDSKEEHAALGAVKWDPCLSPSPLMEWMIHGGTQNNFDDILGQPTVDPRHHFYGSFISLKRSILGTNHFSVQYQSYGWEDLDLGRRLASLGLKLRFLPDAIGLHHHSYSAKDIYRRQYAIGQNLVIYQQNYPKTPLLPRSTLLNRAIHRALFVLGAIPLLCFIVHKTHTKWSTPKLFEIILTAKMKQGIRNAA